MNDPINDTLTGERISTTSAPTKTETSLLTELTVCLEDAGCKSLLDIHRFVDSLYTGTLAHESTIDADDQNQRLD